MSSPSSPWRFEATVNRRHLLLKALLGWTFALLLSLVTAGAIERSAWLGAVFGLLGSVAFGLTGLIHWRMSRVDGPPLVLDEEGLAVNDGLGTRWSLNWHQVEAVGLRGRLLSRRVVLFLRRTGEMQPPTITLPSICHGDAPAEWVAGMIETFRHHALHS
jgi:hypothetical protein